MRIATILTLLLSLMPYQALAQPLAPVQGDVWRGFAERLEVGSRIKIRMRDGQRVTATLIQASPDGLLVQPRTRRPVPVQRVSYDEIASIERDEQRGISGGKAVAIGVASGAGAFFGILLLLIASFD